MSASPSVDRFSLPIDGELPDLSNHDVVDAVETTSEIIEETYYDTVERNLGSAGATLRRSKSGGQTSWVLGIPAEPDGEAPEAHHSVLELSFESAATTPPREVSGLLLAVRGGERLVGLVKLASTRETHTLVNAAGETVAVVIDDVVTSTGLREGTENSQWREVEVLAGVAAAKADVKQIRHGLRDCGATSTSRVNKFDRASPEPVGRTRPKRLAGLVDSYVQTQLEAMSWGDFALRRGHDVTHPTRVAIRRLRSTLAVFAPVFDDPNLDHLDNELAWYAGLLGAVRDCDIAGERVVGALTALPDELVVGSAVAYTEAAVKAERIAATEALHAAMVGRRYAALVSLLEQWRREPPYGAAGTRRRSAAEGYVAAAQKAMYKRLREAAKASADDEQVHRARKAAKRVHYAAEVAADVLGKRAKGVAKEGRRWQRRLGEFQDSRLAADLIYRLAMSDDKTARLSGFSFGLLMAEELQRAEDARHAVRRAFR